jgi:hypothetical protein
MQNRRWPDIGLTECGQHAFSHVGLKAGTLVSQVLLPTQLPLSFTSSLLYSLKARA